MDGNVVWPLKGNILSHLRMRADTDEPGEQGHTFVLPFICKGQKVGAWLPGMGGE